MPTFSGLTIRPLAGFVQALQQLYQAPPDQIRGLDPTSYGSPGQPILPIAPEGVEPRGFQWWWGQNLNYIPRPDAEYSASDLKTLATYPLARICIENVKDLICKAGWEIRLVPEEGETKKKHLQRSQGDDTIKKLSDLFGYPDGENNWSDWVRPLLDDMLVIDAPSILMRKTFKGEIAQLRVLRGESITRLIDENGWTPDAPSPAYQQNWWGLPLVNLTTDQLVYKPRNIVPRNSVSSQLYGMSPTEQMAPEIKIGMKRLEYWLAYYTEGSIPGLIHVVPKGTSPEKISEAMMWMNSELAGNLAARQQWRMIPGFNEPGKADQIVETKKELLADAFDELHIRKICFGFGTSPQRLMRMMGTRNADAQQEAAMEEGIMPWLDWLKGVIDFIIQRKMGLTGYEMIFTPYHEADQEKQAGIATKLVGGCILTPNEGRAMIGEDPWTPKASQSEADMLGTTGQPFSPITGEGALSTPAPTPPPAAGGPGGARVPNKKQPGGGGSGAGASKLNGAVNGLAKAHCAEHDEYDDVCLACSHNEIRRLQSQTTSAVATQRTTPRSSAGPVGFGSGFGSGPVTVELELPRAIDFNTPPYDPDEFDKSAHKYGSTQIDLDIPEFAMLQAKIDTDDLMSHGLEDEPHLTVCYGLLNADSYDIAKLREAFKNVKQFNIAFGKTECFEPSDHSEGSCPLFVSVVEGREQLEELNSLVKQTVEVKPSDHAFYVPHLTIGYINPDEVDKYVGMDDLVGVQARVNAVVVSDVDDNKTSISLVVVKVRKAEDEGEWITINGTHVHLTNEGTIDKGPDEFVGKKPDEIASSREFTRKDGFYDTDEVFGHKVEYLPNKLEAKAYKMEEKDQYETRSIKIEKLNLIPTQDQVGADKVDDIAKKGLISPDDPVKIIQHRTDTGVKNYIWDGHHRLAADLKNGTRFEKFRVFSITTKKVVGDDLVVVNELTKRSPLIGKQIRAGKLQPSSIDAMNRVYYTMRKSLAVMQTTAFRVIEKQLAKRKKYKKADEGDLDPELQQLVDDIMEAIASQFASIPNDVFQSMREAVLRGAGEGLIQVDVTEDNIIEQVNQVARDWADDRAAEMVGMKWDADGALIQNPNPKWAITDSTRNQIQTIITDVFSEEAPTMEAIAARIQQAGTFSDSRAKMIAKTEVISAEVNGNLEAWKGSGIVTKVQVLLSNDHDDDDECDDWADGGPYSITLIPFFFPFHPRCECILAIAGVIGQDEEAV